MCVPYGVAADGKGNVYVADNGNCRILEISPEGNDVTAVAGEERPTDGFLLACGYSGDGGAATAATLAGPNGVAAILTTVSDNGADSSYSGDGDRPLARDLALRRAPTSSRSHIRASTPLLPQGSVWKPIATRLWTSGSNWAARQSTSR